MFVKCKRQIRDSERDAWYPSSRISLRLAARYCKIFLDLTRKITLISLLRKVNCGEIPVHLTLQGLAALKGS
jgi:hypothetical protein